MSTSKIKYALLFLLILVPFLAPGISAGIDEFSVDSPVVPSQEDLITQAPSAEEESNVDAGLDSQVSDQVPVTEDLQSDTALVDETGEDLVGDSGDAEDAEDVGSAEAVPVEIIDPSTLPSISVNAPVVDVAIDEFAEHYCVVPQFTVDMTNTYSMENTIRFKGKSVTNGWVDVLGLPAGMTAEFANTGNARLDSFSGKESTFTIHKTDEAQKGSFNISFLYTNFEAAVPSVTVCQMNLLNL